MKKTILIVGLGNIGTKYTFTRHNIGFLCLDRITEILCTYSQTNHFLTINSGEMPKDLQLRLTAKTRQPITWNLHKSLQCSLAEITLQDFLAPLSSYPNFLSQLKSFTNQNKDSIQSAITQKIQSFSTDYQVILAAPTTFMNLSGESLAKLRKFYNIIQTIIVYDDLDTRFGSINFRTKGSSGGHNGLKSIHALYGEDYLRVKLGVGTNLFLSEKIWDLIPQDKKAPYQILQTLFLQTLQERISCQKQFKTQSFFTILESKVMQEDENLIPFYHEIKKYFSTFHKSANQEIAYFVLSQFGVYENLALCGILDYTAFTLMLIIFLWIQEWENQAKQSNNMSLSSSNTALLQQYIPLDSFQINFK